ncbi:MAG: cobalamin biosynthesis protein [Bacillota bacterium]
MSSIGILAFSNKGMELGRRIEAHFAAAERAPVLARCSDGGLADWAKEHFFKDGALIFIGSCGIAVRAIAPFVKSKSSDPAVVVIDELATYAVSLLSGHIGGANEIAKELALLTGAFPVITTATDRNGVFAIDAWAKTQGLAIENPERIKWICALLLAGETIGIKSLFPVEGTPPAGVSLTNGVYHALITYKTNGKADALRLIPRVLTLGIGCKKDANADAVEAAFELMLAKSGCHALAVRQVCSINLKAGEPGILEFCRKHKLPYRTFSAGELQKVPGTFTASSFVQSVAGVDNVCERSAVLGSGEGGRLLSRKDARFGVTMAIAASPYKVRFSIGE